MSVFKTAGRADVAAADKALAATPNNFMIAFGPGENWWGSQQQVLLALDEDDGAQIAAMHAPVTGVVIRSADAVTLYQVGVDYLVDTATGAISRLPGGSIAAEATIQVTYVATVPEPDLATQSLVSEVGRVSVSAIHFVVPFDEQDDPAANFVNVEGVKYALVEHGRLLLFRGQLISSEGVGEPIRQYGLFSRCAVDPELPPGQTFFEGAEVIEPGVLVISRHRSPVPHDGTVGLETSFLLEI